MLLFYISRKIKKDSKEFKIEVKFLPIRKEEKEKILCDLFDIIFSDNSRGEKPAVDIESQKDKIKLEDK